MTTSLHRYTLLEQEINRHAVLYKFLLLVMYEALFCAVKKFFLTPGGQRGGEKIDDTFKSHVRKSLIKFWRWHLPSTGTHFKNKRSTRLLCNTNFHYWQYMKHYCTVKSNIANSRCPTRKEKKWRHHQESNSNISYQVLKMTTSLHRYIQTSWTTDEQDCGVSSTFNIVNVWGRSFN